MSGSNVLYSSGVFNSTLRVLSNTADIIGKSERTVCHPAEQVVLHICTDRGKVDFRLNPDCAQNLPVANARQLEYLRCLYRATSVRQNVVEWEQLTMGTDPAERMTSPPFAVYTTCVCPSTTNSTPQATNSASSGAEATRVTKALTRIFRLGRDPACSRYAYNASAHHSISSPYCE